MKELLGPNVSCHNKISDCNLLRKEHYVVWQMLVTFIVISLDLYATLSYCLVKTAYGSVFKSMPQGGEMNQALYAHMNNKRKMKKKKKTNPCPNRCFHMEGRFIK
jgi:hypothetical protein